MKKFSSGKNSPPEKKIFSRETFWKRKILRIEKYLRKENISEEKILLQRKILEEKKSPPEKNPQMIKYLRRENISRDLEKKSPPEKIPQKRKKFPPSVTILDTATARRARGIISDHMVSYL